MKMDIALRIDQFIDGLSDELTPSEFIEAMHCLGFSAGVAADAREEDMDPDWDADDYNEDDDLSDDLD